MRPGLIERCNGADRQDGSNRVGPITASAIPVSVPDASLFRSGRQFAAWLGLAPKPHSSGGKERHTGITKQGDGYIRRLLVVDATAVLRYARQKNARKVWAFRLLAGKRPKVVLVNKTARIAWALAQAQRSVFPARSGVSSEESQNALVLRGDDEPAVPGDRNTPWGQGAIASAQF